jgi:hypothetical protein
MEEAPMNRITTSRFVLFTLVLVGVLAGSVASVFAATNPTPTPTSAVVTTRVFNDCPTSTLNVVNNYPSLISFEDSNVDCFGFANLHVFHLSEDGVNEAAFDNNSSWRFDTDFKIEGDGSGEGGIQVAPWWSHNADGLFNVRSSDGEIACFGGRLPFFTFTGGFGLRYTKGDVIHLGVVYEPRALNAGRPATITYNVDYKGTHYTSGPLNFDMANPAEDPPHGLWGMLNDGRVGGHFKAFLGQGNPVTVKATFSNMVFGTTPNPTSIVVKTRIFNDCPTSNLLVDNQAPKYLQIWEHNLDCFGFANLHNWRWSENGTDPAIFNNNAKFRFTAELNIENNGDPSNPPGNGEAGLSIAPWWSKDVDGRFNVRSTDGEIACFGGRLPFFTFTGAFGLRYVPNTWIHMEIMYDPHGRTAVDPATVEYKLTYNGTDYTSGPLPFDQANPAEDPPYGAYGMLNDGQAGGYFQAFLTGGTPSNVKATWTDITWSTCVHPVFVYCEVFPHNFDLNSHGKLVYMTLEPSDNNVDYKASDIDVASIQLNGVPVSTLRAPKISRHDSRLTVWFDRAAVAATLTPGPHRTALMSGEIGSNCFDEYDYINVRQHHVHCPNSVFAPGSVAELSWDVDPELPVSHVTLVSSFDNGVTWRIEASNIANNGHYSWHVPNTPGTVLLNLVDQALATDDPADGIVADTELGASDAFVIQSPLSVGGPVAEFALRVPNPVSGKLVPSFSLASTEPAELAVFDVAGRAMLRRDVGGHSGSQSVSLGTLPTGLYLVRLSQAGRSLSQRIAVIQ